jgi:hypothetical protein
MSTETTDVREVQLSSIAHGEITVADVRTVFLATYAANIYADPDREVARLVDGETVYSISHDWLSDLLTVSWVLRRLPVLARPTVLSHIIALLHNALDEEDQDQQTDPASLAANGGAAPHGE